MGSFRFRKQFKLLPGVKLNVDKQSVSVTLGGRGAHVTYNSKGQRTTSVGLPGSGLSWRDTRKVSRGAEQSAQWGSMTMGFQRQPTIHRSWGQRP
jgi:hypothetical protein